jgi:hypothetical protein
MAMATRQRLIVFFMALFCCSCSWVLLHWFAVAAGNWACSGGFLDLWWNIVVCETIGGKGSLFGTQNIASSNHLSIHIDYSWWRHSKNSLGSWELYFEAARKRKSIE